MANTFNLGNGSWAQKTEKLLAYNAENDNYKPLPFDFDRSTGATRVNRQGLIETVGIDEPRIDFLNNTKGHLLLEPQSQNTATYSNDFTQGIIFNASNQASLTNSVLTSNQATSPNGANDAWLFKDDNSGGSNSVFLNYFNAQVNSNDNNVISIFVKKALSNNFFSIQTTSFDSSANGNSYFNIKDGTLGTISGNHTAKIEDYGNGWYRCSVIFKTTTDTIGAVRFRVANQDNISSVPLDGTNGVYLFGLQCEASATQNYVTSYIPTQGSAETRSAEDAANTSTEVLSLSNQASFYWYLKGQAGSIDLNNTGYVMRYNLDTSADNVSYVAFNTTLTEWRIRLQSGSLSNFNSTSVSKFEDVKIVVTVNTSTYSIYANGALIVSRPYDGDAITFENIRIQFDINNENRGTINIADTRAYNTELTQAEAIALTTL